MNFQCCRNLECKRQKIRCSKECLPLSREIGFWAWKAWWLLTSLLGEYLRLGEYLLSSFSLTSPFLWSRLPAVTENEEIQTGQKTFILWDESKIETGGPINLIELTIILSYMRNSIIRSSRSSLTIPNAHIYSEPINYIRNMHLGL